MMYMDRFFIDELKVRTNEILTRTIAISELNEIVTAYNRIIYFSNQARNEGLLALEEASADLDLSDESQELFFKLINLVVDGTEPDLVRIIGINKCISMNLHSYHGLMNLMYLQGALMIQAGDKPWIIEELLKSMLPKQILDEIKRLESEKADLNKISKEKEAEDKINMLCCDNKVLDEKDHSVVGELAKTLMMLSDIDTQRLLREVNNGTLAVAMKGMPGCAKARIFDNMSPRLAVILADDILYMGPVRLKDVEDDCVKIIRVILKLYNAGEINDYDFSILKVIMDIFDSTEKSNAELKERYKELRSVINRIYND